MKWIKSNDRRPDGKEKEKIHIKYKGSSDLLIFINSIWYWYEKSIEESRNFPVHEGSWAAIEWLDESATLPSSSVTGESEAIGERKFTLKEIREAFCHTYNVGKAFPGNNKNKDEKQYFKQTFGIDI